MLPRSSRTGLELRVARPRGYRPRRQRSGGRPCPRYRPAEIRNQRLGKIFGEIQRKLAVGDIALLDFRRTLRLRLLAEPFKLGDPAFLGGDLQIIERVEIEIPENRPRTFRTILGIRVAS